MRYRILVAALLSACIVLPVEARKKKKKEDEASQPVMVVQQVPVPVTMNVPAGAATVTNPEIPKSIIFGGEKIDIDDYDKVERLDRELTAMMYTHGNTLLQLKRANRYFPQLGKILEKNGIPRDLLYLACIESMLNPTAVSPAKAAGLWQFMPETGRQYGLEVNDYVDERMDPVKATEAACRYLKQSHNKYGNWESAAAAYNAGQGRISRDLNSQGQTTAFDLWLPEETMRYMFRLLATKLIMENPEQYGFQLSEHQLYPELEYRAVEVKGPINDWVQWAKDNGTSYYMVRRHNPWIRNKSLPNTNGKTYKVLIPTEESMKRK